MKLKLLTNGKGAYPYSLCNDAHIMKKIVEFPPMEDLFNDLTNISSATEDYNFALKVYNTFNCKNLYEYTLLSKYADTLIIAEIMMVYRKIIQAHSQMDINHCLGTPGLSITIVLKTNKIKFEKHK